MSACDNEMRTKKRSIGRELRLFIREYGWSRFLEEVKSKLGPEA